MSEIKRKWDLLDEAQKKPCIDELIRYFEIERGEQIGVIAAQNVLDCFLEVAGKELYNMGVKDAQKGVQQKVEDLQFELDSLLD